MLKGVEDALMGKSDKKNQKQFWLPLAQKVKLLEKLNISVSMKCLTEDNGFGMTIIDDLKKQMGKLLKFCAENDE